LFECGGPDLRVILASTQGAARVVRMQELLPGGFRLASEAAPAARGKRKAGSARTRA